VLSATDRHLIHPVAVYPLVRPMHPVIGLCSEAFLRQQNHCHAANDRVEVHVSLVVDLAYHVAVEGGVAVGGGADDEGCDAPMAEGYGVPKEEGGGDLHLVVVHGCLA